MEVTSRGICPRNCIHQRDTQHSYGFISRLEYNPEVNSTNEQSFANLGIPTKGHRWNGFAALWHSYNGKNQGAHGQDCNFNHVFANCTNEEEIYPLTAQEVPDAQRVDATIKHCFKRNHVFDKDLDIRLVGKISVVCKNGRMVIPKPLQRCAILWFHHYLQHPGHSRLEEIMQAMMYWKGMRTTIRAITKACRTCQVNKKRKIKYGHLPLKSVIMTPWTTLCVDLVSPYTLTTSPVTIEKIVSNQFLTSS